MFEEFQLHQQGISYELQGFLQADGILMARKVEEHLYVSKCYSRARSMRKPKRK